jgi:predicted metal-dependent hydrolase
MATKSVEVAGIGTVALHKRRGARNIRLSITHSGEVRVTLPFWAPYKAGIDFILSKSEWILEQKPEIQLISQGYQVGKAHHITFEAGQGNNISTRLTGNEARVLLPVGIRWDSPAAQQAANSVGIKALKKEAKQLLPKRLQTLAYTHGYTFRDVSVKQLKGRWGSCSEQKDIVLNCFLMKLPWDLIDYVLLHELAHTRVMAHGTPFWTEMERHTPHIKQLRKAIKEYKPTL